MPNPPNADEPLQVLVVDDDAGVRTLLQDYLGDHGYAVRLCEDAAGARQALAQRVPQVVLLDVGLPGEDGLSLARHIREHHDIGIIMISGAGDTIDRIVGLEVGADDYVSKPFEPRELRARLKSVARRYLPAARTVSTPVADSRPKLAIGQCWLDLARYQLQDRDGNEIPVTVTEFELLRAFAERPNHPLSRDQILNLTMNRDWDPNDRSVDIRIARLRKKIEPDPEHPCHLKTVRGIGYMFVP